MNQKQEKWLMVATFATVALLTLLPFFKIGFATDDDFQYFVTAHRSWQQWMEDAKWYAVCSGRFYFLITKYFYYVPYLIDSFVYTKAVQYISLTACYGVFSYLIFRLFRSSRLAVITLLLLFFNTAITPQDYFIPNINYPFYFTFSSIIFMLAVIVYIDYCEQGGRWRIFLSAMLCLLSYLFYETYLLLSLFLFAAIIVRHWRNYRKEEKHWIRLCGTLCPYLLVVVIYVACYFGFRVYLRSAYPDFSLYDGCRFDASQFSLSNFFVVLERCTRIALPGQTYFYNRGLIADNSLFFSGHHRGLFNIFAHASSVVWINAILQAVLLWWLTRDSRLRRLSWTTLAVGFVGAVVMAFSVHSLIAITPKYNIEWIHWIMGYVTSFYSIMLLMAAFALVIAASLKATRSPKWQRTVRAMWCVVLLSFSVIIGYTNEHISREWQKSQNRLTAIDLMAEQGFFDSLPDDAILYTLPLHNTPGIRFGNHESQKDIEGYINIRAKRNIFASASWDQVTNQKSLSPSSPVYYVHAAANPKGNDLLIAVSRLDDTTIASTDSVTTSKCHVFYLSPSKHFTLFYQADGGLHSLDYQSDDIKKPLCHVVISCDGIKPNSITVSNMILPSVEQ